MILTNRDLNLFSKLQGYGFLTTRQLEQFVFTGTTTSTVLRRLRCLESEKYIARIPLTDRGALAWSLTPKGSKLVSTSPPKRAFRPDLLEHDQKLVAMRLELECSGVALSWIPEHEIRHQVFKRNGIDSGRTMLVPDGIMGTKSVTGISESVAIELELNFKNSGRYSTVFSEYRSRKNLGFLWYVVSTPTIGRAALKTWHELRYPETSVRFYWSQLSDVLKNPHESPLYGANSTTPLNSIWKPREPALPPAQGVGGLAAQNSSFQTDLTAEISA